MPRRSCCFLIILFIFFIVCYKVIRKVYFTSTPSFDLRKENGDFPILTPIAQPYIPLDQELFVLVLVSSSPNKEQNAQRREMFRRFWGYVNKTDLSSGNSKPRWKVVFMMGKTMNREQDKSIMAEHERYGDLLIGDYKDNYWTIITKLLMALKWASKIRFEYILKTDDDVYVDIPKLINWLAARSFPQSFYGGVTYSSYVIRDKGHRHFVSPEILPIVNYPTFCKGAMLVLSWNLVPEVVELSKQIPRFPIDDAYLGIVVYHLGVTPVAIGEFFQRSYLPWLVDYISPCQFKETIGFGDSLTPRQMFYIHQQMRSVATSASSNFCISVHMKISFTIIFLVSCLVVLFLCCRRRNVFQRLWHYCSSPKNSLHTN